MRQLIAIFLLLLFGSAVEAQDTQALNQQADYWGKKGRDTVLSKLERDAILNGNRLYTAFAVSAPSRPRPVPQQGFAPPVPSKSESIVPRGVMEITLESLRPSVSCMTACPPFTVSVTARISGYRIYTPTDGWQASRGLDMPYIWLWQGSTENGVLSLQSLTLGGRGTSDDRLAEFVASVFNISPGSVQVSRPTGIPR